MVDPLRAQTTLDRLGAEVAALDRLGRFPAAELLADEDKLAAILKTRLHELTEFRVALARAANPRSR
jgi:hypothetical protein